MLAARFLNVRPWVQVWTKFFLSPNIHGMMGSPLVAGRYCTFVTAPDHMNTLSLYFREARYIFMKSV